MIKLVLIFATAIIIINIINIFSQNNEIINLYIGDYQILIEQNILILLAISSIIFTIFICFLLANFFANIKFKKLAKENKNYKNSLNEITKCLTLNSIGDIKESNKFLNKLTRKINHPIIDLIKLQNSLLTKENNNIIKNCKKLLTNQETKHIAIQAMAIASEKKEAYDHAIKLLEESHKEYPNAKNISLKLIELYKKCANWEKLKNIIELTSKQKEFNEKDYEEDLSIALLMLAKNAPNPKEHKLLIKKAQTINPSHIEIQNEYAIYLSNFNHKIILIKYLKNIWKNNQSKILIDLFFEKNQNKSAKYKLKTLKQLININKRGEAAIVNYIKLAYEHNLHITETKSLIKQYLESTNSKAIYEISLEFLEKYSDNYEDSDYIEEIKKKKDSYINSPNYLCKNCNFKHDSWEAICKNCLTFNQITYDYEQKLSLIKTKNI